MVLLLSYLLSALAWTALSPAAGSVSARKIDRTSFKTLQRQAADRFNENRLTVQSPGNGDLNFKLGGGVKNFTFSNPAASGECLCLLEFWVAMLTWGG